MFKERLKELRIKKGITQSELAELLGVSPKMIEYYESGLRTPRNKKIQQKLAEVFQVPVDELIVNVDKTFADILNLKDRLSTAIEDYVSGERTGDLNAGDMAGYLMEVIDELKIYNN